MSLPPPLEQFSLVAVDTETTGLKWYAGAMPFIISLAVPDGRSWALNLREPNVTEWCRDNIPKIRCPIFFNIKFDLHMLSNIGVRVNLSNAHCSAVYAALINEHLDSYSLEAVSQHYLGEGKDTSLYEKLADLFGGKPTRAQMTRVSEAPFDMIESYAKKDAELTLRLFNTFWPMIQKQDIEKVAGLEMALIPALYNMERHGVRVDVKRAEESIDVCSRKVEQLQAALDAEAGFFVNVNSSKHMQDIFRPVPVTENGRLTHYQLADGTMVPKTLKGSPSLNKDVMDKTEHPCAKIIRDLKTYQKIRDTFLLGHVLGHQVNGRLHPNYNSTRTAHGDDEDFGTTSGRFSCNDPNIQQISKRNPIAGAMVRSLFLPDMGDDWATIDFDQMDFRVMTHFLRNRSIDKIYQDNPEADFHQVVADMTGLPRKATPGIKGDAKSINLGLCFGMGKGKMAEQMGLPYAIHFREDGSEFKVAGPEADEIFEKYHQAVPGIADMLKFMTNVAKSRGYIKTLVGRRIRFVRGEKTYKAGAMIFQGNAAEALKVKIVEVSKLLHGSGAHLLVNVHDELGISMEGKNVSLAKEIQRLYTTFDGNNEWGLAFRTPIRGKMSFGENWWEASK